MAVPPGEIGHLNKGFIVKPHTNTDGKVISVDVTYADGVKERQELFRNGKVKSVDLTYPNGSKTHINFEK